MRGAGTSIAGNAVGPGIVVDTVKHLNRVVSIDPEARTAVVQPGVVHADLQRAAAPHGLRFGPDPSTHTRCTIGGMIGNNACGSRALGYGRTVDNVVALDVAFGDGERSLGPRRRARRPTRSVSASAGRAPRARPDRVRPVRPPGQRLLARAPAARARPQRRPVPRRLGGHPRRWSARPRCGWSRTRPSGCSSCSATRRWSRPRTPCPALLAATDGAMVACEGLDARIVDLVRAQGQRGARAADGRGLAVRRGRRRRGAGGWPAKVGRRRAARSATGWSTTPPRRPRSGGSARTAPAWPRAA